MRNLINAIVFIFLFVVATAVVYFVSIWLIMSYGTLLPTSPITYKAVTYLMPLVAVALTLFIFKFVRMNPYKDLPEDVRLQKRIRNVKNKSIILLVIGLVFLLFSKGSSFLYYVSGCSGGVGSGIRCSSALEPLVVFSQWVGFMVALSGLGFIFLEILYLGLFFLARYFVLKRQSTVR